MQGSKTYFSDYGHIINAGYEKKLMCTYYPVSNFNFIFLQQRYAQNSVDLYLNVRACLDRERQIVSQVSFKGYFCTFYYLGY